MNEIRLNGKDGKFIYTDILNKKVGEKAAVTELGESIKVVFLKIRRRLAWYKADVEMFYISTEHNFKDDEVYLFGAKKKGIASKLREEFPLLKTQQIVYAFWIKSKDEKELVKLIIKGSSLGSKNKDENTTSFYDYLGNHKKDEHSYQFITELCAVKETGNLGHYYAINFIRGERVSLKNMPVVIDEIKRLAALCKEQDEFYKVNEISETLPVVEYPEEEINPEDIPF